MSLGANVVVDWPAMSNLFCNKYKEYCRGHDLKGDDIFKMSQKEDEMLEDYVAWFMFNLQCNTQHHLNEEKIVDTRLSKYVKRHHPTTQIIGDKDCREMTRNKFRNDTCFLIMEEPKIVKYSLEDVNYNKAMEEEIEQIEKNKTWT